MARVLITGTHSGCGKTMVTCALLKALKERGLPLAAFKCGPDYIDPMFHRQALGVPSYNLDPFFCPPAKLRGQLNARGRGLSLLEGAMGYYDGVGPAGRYSAHEVAQSTQTPAVLVISAKGMYTSAGALLQGFATYRDPSGIGGVIFNQVSPMVYEGLAEIARQVGIKPLGFLPPEPQAAVESRHLGLVTAAELTDLETRLSLLGELARKHLDLDGLLDLAETAPPLNDTLPPVTPLGRVRIAVARDEAFCFLYQENLDMLEALGCQLVYFSPLTEKTLPQDIGGLYLPGGYPELYLETLSANASLREEVRRKVAGGLPTVAECGGFLYLHDTLGGYPMAGVIHGAGYPTGKLRRFGYHRLRANRDNLLCRKGESIPSHEFHYWDSNRCGGDFTAQKGDRQWFCVHAGETLYAGFPHLYWEAAPNFAENFVRKAIDYGIGNAVGSHQTR